MHILSIWDLTHICRLLTYILALNDGKFNNLCDGKIVRAGCRKKMIKPVLNLTVFKQISLYFLGNMIFLCMEFCLLNIIII